MHAKSFHDKLAETTQRNNSLLCVGLDPDPARFPSEFGTDPTKLYKFNKMCIDATADLVNCYKINSAFYEAYGADGITQMIDTVSYIRKHHPSIPVILDAKRGDIGNTNERYAHSAFTAVAADAATIHPYQGVEAVAPFFADPNKAVFVLAKTSNPDSSQFQNSTVHGGKPLYITVIEAFLGRYGEAGNCLFVAGATYPEELAAIRALVGDSPLLVPGTGAQGGNIADMVPVGANSNGTGLIINASRSVIYAGDTGAIRLAAQTLRDQINEHR